MSESMNAVTESKDRNLHDNMETERAAKKDERKATKWATKAIFDDLDRFQNLDDSLQEKFADRLSEKINDLYKDAKENYVNEEFYNDQNLEVLQGIFYKACNWSFDLSEKLNFLSCHWYKKVRKEEIRERTQFKNTKEQTITESVISKTPDDDTEQQRKRKSCHVDTASDNKKHRKTQLEVKAGEHWECTECKKGWTRKANCCKHILEFHPQGNAEAAHRLGKKETLLDPSGKAEENLVLPEKEVENTEQSESSLSTSQDDFDGNAKDELHLLDWNGLNKEQTEDFFALLGGDYQ